MPTWNDLLTTFQAFPDDQQRSAWLESSLVDSLKEVGKLRGGARPRNVIFYGSAFLQKPGAPFQEISWDDVNALMSVVNGMDCSKGLTLILHTPGGHVNAAESFVAYLRSKFDDIEVIIPALAMSAGTMISLSSKRIVMGRQSQLGPIDPQFVRAGTSISATAVTELFKQAKSEVLANTDLALVWAPILQSLGPSLLLESQQALAYGERMVAEWLKTGMFSGETDAEARGKRVAAYFNNATNHLSHGRRIDINEARANGVVCEELEVSQDLQDAVLTAYHLATIAFNTSPALRVFVTSEGRSWYRNIAIQP
jgi:hypothetical protein